MFNNDDFDAPNPKKLVLGVIGLWAFCFALGLGLLGGIVYVAWHFISKVW